MPDSKKTEVTTTVVTEGMDRSTRLMLWAVAGVLLMLVALISYAYLSGTFGSSAPRTTEERALDITDAAIRSNPSEGSSYAIRAEALFKLGKKAEAYQVLDQGEKAVKGQNPALLYILRARTALLNREGKYAEAEKVGIKAMAASDDYLAIQGAELSKKGVTGIAGNMQVQMSIDTAIQLAGAYAAQKKWDKAIELYTYALKLDPLGGDLLTLRGFAYLGKGDKVKAKADFEQTLKYLPNDPEATRGMKALSN
jgi:tetratricopeptide (TPR) repeat protein